MKQTDWLDSMVKSSGGSAFTDAFKMFSNDAGEDFEVQHIDETFYSMRDIYTLLRQYEEDQWRVGNDVLAPCVLRLKRMLHKSDLAMSIKSVRRAAIAWLKNRGIE